MNDRKSDNSIFLFYDLDYFFIRIHMLQLSLIKKSINVLLDLMSDVFMVLSQLLFIYEEKKIIIPEL